MKKFFKTYKELEEFAKILERENKWVMSVSGDDTSGYEAQWIEQKFYTAQDGQTFADEVWITKEGEMKCIQDLDTEHARNIIRMLIRQSRVAKETLNLLLDQLEQEATDSANLDKAEDVKPHILH